MKAADRFMCRRCGSEGARDELTCSRCLRDTRLLDLDVLPATATKARAERAEAYPQFTALAAPRVLK